MQCTLTKRLTTLPYLVETLASLRVLIDNGWAWKNQSVPIYRLTIYDGYGFIQQAVDEFNRTTKYKFQVKVESKYKESYYAQM